MLMHLRERCGHSRRCCFVCLTVSDLSKATAGEWRGMTNRAARPAYTSPSPVNRAVGRVFAMLQPRLRGLARCRPVVYGRPVALPMTSTLYVDMLLRLRARCIFGKVGRSSACTLGLCAGNLSLSSLDPRPLPSPRTRSTPHAWPTWSPLLRCAGTFTQSAGLSRGCRVDDRRDGGAGRPWRPFRPPPAEAAAEAGYPHLPRRRRQPVRDLGPQAGPAYRRAVPLH